MKAEAKCRKDIYPTHPLNTVMPLPFRIRGDEAKPKRFEDALEEWLDTVTRERGGVCFTETIKFYLPTCGGRCEDAVSRFINVANRVFGGSTNYRAEGCWVSPEGETVCEPIIVVESAHHCTKEREAKEIAEALLKYAEEADQQWLAVSQGRFYSFPAR